MYQAHILLLFGESNCNLNWYVSPRRSCIVNTITDFYVYRRVGIFVLDVIHIVLLGYSVYQSNNIKYTLDIKRAFQSTGLIAT